ncbi:thioesterase domain-containing protein, partial [Chitinophaga sancti]|uniref:thioesterase domain-containing protein n=1 Tax=Chitinophaga sancti TaxID=1004 RepID=UPI003F7A1DA1
PETATEQTLARIWEDVLGKQQIGVDDNFFEIGGHSLRAIQVISRIFKAFHCRLTLGSFMQNPTIGAQAAILSATNRHHEPALIVAIDQHQAGRPALYLLPPLIGSPLVYKKIANTLSGCYNCYGLQDAGFDQAEKIDLTLSEKVRLFANQIIEHATEKKVRLMGFSYGATVAFEVAKMLEQEGFETTLLVIDRPVIKRRSFLGLKTASAEHEDINQFLDKIKMIDPAISYLNDITINWNNNIKLTEKYQQKGSIKGKLIAFKSKENMSKDFLSMEDWNEFTVNAFTHYYLSGDHYESLELDENIDKIYEALQQHDNIKEVIKAGL